MDAKQTLEILKKAKEFYEAVFEVSGGCDHSVGICECADRDDYGRLVALIAMEEAKERNREDHQ